MPSEYTLSITRDGDRKPTRFRLKFDPEVPATAHSAIRRRLEDDKTPFELFRNGGRKDRVRFSSDPRTYDLHRQGETITISVH